MLDAFGFRGPGAFLYTDRLSAGTREGRLRELVPPRLPTHESEMTWERGERSGSAGSGYRVSLSYVVRADISYDIRNKLKSAVTSVGCRAVPRRL